MLPSSVLFTNRWYTVTGLACPTLCARPMAWSSMYWLYSGSMKIKCVAQGDVKAYVAGMGGHEQHGAPASKVLRRRRTDRV